MDEGAPVGHSGAAQTMKGEMRQRVSYESLRCVHCDSSTFRPTVSYPPPNLIHASVVREEG